MCVSVAVLQSAPQGLPNSLEACTAAWPWKTTGRRVPLHPAACCQGPGLGCWCQTGVGPPCPCQQVKVTTPRETGGTRPLVVPSLCCLDNRHGGGWNRRQEATSLWVRGSRFSGSAPAFKEGLPLPARSVGLSQATPVPPPKRQVGQNPRPAGGVLQGELGPGEGGGL